MIKSWKFWTVMLGIGGLVALFAYGFTTDPKLVKSPLVGRPAPNFTITDFNTGDKLTLAELKGKPFILNFWASWCTACREEAVLLEEAHQLYENDQGKVRVIGIAIQDKPADAKAFAKRYGKTYFLALDAEEGDISLNYGLYGVPETFFVDGEGVIRYKQIGALTMKVIREQVAKLAGSGGGRS